MRSLFALLAALVFCGSVHAAVPRSSGGIPATARTPWSFEVLGPSANFHLGKGNYNPNGEIFALRFTGMTSGGTVDFSGAKTVTITITRPGFDTACVATTLSETFIVALTGVREPYPQQTTALTEQVGADTVVYGFMNRRVFSGDTVTAVTVGAGSYTQGSASLAGTVPVRNLKNSSTLAYPDPLVGWAVPQLQRATSTLHVELSGASWAARNGQEFACVQTKVTTTGNVDQGINNTISAPTQSTFLTLNTPQIPEVYAADINTSTLTTGTAYDVVGIVCPWVGTACFDTRNGGTPLVTQQGFTNLRFLADPNGTYGNMFAVVRECGAGSCASCTASTVYATAYTTGCTTVTLALSALKTANNAKANTGVGKHNDAGGGTVYLSSDALTAKDWPSFGGAVSAMSGAVTWATIAPDPNATGIRWVTGASKDPGGGYIKFSGVTMDRAVVAGTIADWEMVDGGSSNNRVPIWADRVNWSPSTTNASSPGPLYRVGLQYWTNSTVVSGGSQMFIPAVGSVSEVPSLIGANNVSGTFNNQCTIFPQVVLGNYFQNGCQMGDQVTANNDGNDGAIVGFNRFNKQQQNAYSGVSLIHTRGYADFVNLYEIVTNGVNAAKGDAPDGSSIAYAGYVGHHVTVVGDRDNNYYSAYTGNSYFSIIYKTLGSQAFVILEFLNTKSDQFQYISNAASCSCTVSAQNRMGNSGWRWGVNRQGIIVRQGGSDLTTSPGTGSWLGETTFPQTQFTATIPFTSDISKGHGAGTGGGDYTFTTCTANPACNVNPTGTQTNKYGLNGSVFAAVDAAGAYPQP